jgi:aerobic carbon-monoxide dehydrogenase large subunit
MPGHHVTVTVNGEQRRAEVEARKLLVHLLRDDFGVTSAHVGCDTTQCGACTVRLDGRAVKSCTVLAVQADGAAVDTVESLSTAGDAEHPLLSAFRDHHALQCGFCTPGMVMSSLELLQREPRASEERVRAWLKGNFCRCTGYQHIVDAIRATDGVPASHEAGASPPSRSPRDGARNGNAGASDVGGGTEGTSAPHGSRFFGRPRQRREDDHHLRGRGQFTDDVRPAGAAGAGGALHAALVRSPHAHARIRSVSVDRAAKMPGVVAVVTGADLAGSVSPLPTNWVLPGMQVPVHRVLAGEVARFQGEAVAAVVAGDAYTAADAVGAIEVDYEPLPAVTDPWRATEPSAALVHPELGSAAEDGNVVFRVPIYAGDYAAAREQAEVVTRQRLRNQNLIPCALEPRSVLADYDERTGRVTVHSSTQSPHIIKRMLAGVLSFPEDRLRVVAPDVGGGFGSKLHLYPEEVLVTALAIRLRRAVKWTATRSEDFTATNHGRDQVQDVELCATADGIITGLKATLYANLGAYLSGMAAGIPTANCSLMLTGCYRIPNIHIDTLGVVTNTSRVDTYRGAGRPEATYLIERMVDQLARELGIDPAEIRRRNFIPPEAFPYQSPLFVFDSGNYAHNLDTALGIVGYEALRREQAELRGRGRYRGIGLATYTEFTGLGPGRDTAAVGFAYGGWEYARVLVLPTGRVSVHVGTADHGQGHATSYAQIAAEVLGLPPDDIDIAEGDTATVEFGQGTFNSRSMPVGGTAVYECSQKVLAKATRFAAHAMAAAVEDVRYEAGVFAAPKRTDDGHPGSMTWDDVARLAHFVPDIPPGLEPGLDERVFYDPKGVTFPFGTYIAVVDVDVATGDITIDRFLAVDDCGPLINPLLARGQIHGGIVQGLGQALLEGASYDDHGSLVSRDWTGYAFPRAQYIPRLETAHTITPSPFTCFGIKGIGEAGAIGSPPAIVNAVLDALAPLGVTHLDMPLHPEQVLAAIRRAAGGGGTLAGAQ